MYSQDLVLQIVESATGGDPCAPGLYIEGSGASFASFKVLSPCKPSADEISARLAATDSDFILLSYDERRGSGLIAIVDFDPPEAGERVSLLPAQIPRKITIVFERATSSRL